MAVKTFYLLNTTATTPNWFGSLQDGGSAPAGAMSAFGFGNAKSSLPFWQPRIGATALSTTGSNTSYAAITATSPTAGTGASATTAGDSFRSATTYTGTFAAGNWTLAFGMRTAAATHTGHVNCVVWAGTNANGTGARALSPQSVSWLNGTNITLNATATTFTSTCTWAAPSVTLNNEYLFIMPEWQVVTAGGSNSCSAQFYQSAGIITTTDFSVGNSGALGLTQANQTISADGTTTGAVGSLALTEASDTLVAAGSVPYIGTLNLAQAAQAGRSNYIRNPRAEGAVAATPGTAPTFWTGYGNQSGLTQTIVGTGTEDGIPYIDVRYVGTNTALSYIRYFEPNGAGVGIPATYPQPCVFSFYMRLVGGSLANVQPKFSWTEYNAAGSALGQSTIDATPTSAPLISQRRQLATSIAKTDCATLAPYWTLEPPSTGLAVDVTLRIGAPQFERGTTVSAPILPPIGTPGVSGPRVGTGGPVVGGTLTKTEDSDALSAAGTVDQPAGGGDITGTLALTEAGDTIGANATVLVTGTLNISQAAQTISAQGKVLVGGTLAVTEAADTISAAGTVDVRGTLGITEIADTIAAQGGVQVRGTLTRTQADHTLAGVAGPVAGAALNLAQAPQTISAQGGVTVRGTLGLAQAAQTINAAGSVLTGVGGALNVTQAAQTLSAAGTVPLAVIGTLGITQASQTIGANATVVVGGTLSLTELIDTINAAGAVGIGGSLLQTQAPHVLSAFATVGDIAPVGGEQARVVVLM